MNSLSVLYTDKHLTVAVKPAGMLSQSDEKGRDSILSALKEILKCEIYPVHRLDRETAGVMVFARTSYAAAALSSALQKKEFTKEYLAVLTARPSESEGILEDLLFFDRRKGKVFPVKRSRRGVKDARLRYAFVEEENGLSLVRVFPETGRTHQIRVQFASRKMPLFGDRKYGGGGDGLALFCHTLSFPHPKTGELLTFSASPEEKHPWNMFSSITR